MPQTPIVMPKMSMTMTEGELVEYTVIVGQQIKSGDVVAVVGTDKTNMEVEAEVDGIVIELCANPLDVLEVGKPMLILETEGEDLLADLFTPAASQTPVAEAPATEVQAPMAAHIFSEILAMPGARKLAVETGIELNSIKPASPSGVIKVSDLAAPQDPERAQKARLQMAKLASLSLAIPQFTITSELVLKKLLPGDSGARMQELCRAWEKTIRKNSVLNSSFVSENISEVGLVKIAILTKTQIGFVSPVIAIDQGTGWETELPGLLAKARMNKIPIENLSGATTAIYDFAEFGIGQANVLLLPGQSTALVIGKGFQQGQTEKMHATLVVDHRIADPGEAAIALRDLEQLLNGG